MNVSVKAIYEQLQKQGIDVQPVGMTEGKTLLLFSYAGSERAVRGSIADLTTATAVMMDDDKHAASVFAERLAISQPGTTQYEDMPQAEAFLRRYGTIVVKPLDSAHGNGVTTGISSIESLDKAVERARTFSSVVLLQQQVTGIDLRILIIDGQAVAIAERVPAAVTGDGEHTIRELITIENTTNPDRGVNYEKPLNIISEDGAEAFLGAQLDEIPQSGETVQVVGTANLGTGGTIVDRTNDPSIPKEMIDQAVKFAVKAGLFCAGMDFMFDEINQEWKFIEANASPSFAVHWHPINGEGIDLASIFVSKLLARYDAAQK